MLSWVVMVDIILHKIFCFDKFRLQVAIMSHEYTCRKFEIVEEVTDEITCCA